MAEPHDNPGETPQPEDQVTDAGQAAQDAVESAQQDAAEIKAGVEDEATPLDATTEERTTEALQAAQEALATASAGVSGASPIEEVAAEAVRAHKGEARSFTPPPIHGENGTQAARDVNLLADVGLHVKIELGRTRMYVEDVLKLGEGAVVELDKAAGDPVDIYVNDRHVARGEVLVINDCFCVRVSEIVASAAAD